MRRQKTRNDYGEYDKVDIPLDHMKIKQENLIEAVVQDGDTLQAIALRFDCSIGELKRINKIDKDNEIFAKNIIKVPITSRTILLEQLPAVHKSGNNSPKKLLTSQSSINKEHLDEKLLIASVSYSASKSNTITNINDIILNTNIKPIKYSDIDETIDNNSTDINEEIDLLLPKEPHIIKLPKSNDFTCSGSDCDISWLFLLICILALCFAIPLIYVFYIAEHPEKFHHNSTK